jgi:hypothetical protein
MTTPPRCTCPLKTDQSGQVVRAMTDQLCPVHGSKKQELPHCATCTCEKPPIVQTPQTAAEATLRHAEKSEAPPAHNQ